MSKSVPAEAAYEQVWVSLDALARGEEESRRLIVKIMEEVHHGCVAGGRGAGRRQPRSCSVGCVALFRVDTMSACRASVRGPT